MKKLEKEEKEEYQLYAWNKKKEKYVPVSKPQPSLNLCKECLSILSKFSNPLIFDEHRTKIYKRKRYVQISYTKWEEVNLPLSKRLPEGGLFLCKKYFKIFRHIRNAKIKFQNKEEKKWEAM